MTGSNIIVLISGANRGLGRGLLEKYLAQPNHTVIAANRAPNPTTAKELQDLPTGPGSKVIIVKLDASVTEDAFNAVRELQSEGIQHIDIVIANAGVSYKFLAVKDLEAKDMQDHLVPNVYGVVSLYQATRDLLNKAEKPKFITMGSSAGWLEKQHSIPNAAYGPTKAAVHWLTKRMDGEEDKITAFVTDPGWVQTDMGNNGARALGVGDMAPLPIDDSVSGMKKVIDVATKESHGGHLWGWDGQKQQW
ncbi:Norsolorinic acid ketoreductase nor1 [Pseudocercospora fuligena]|uniref:Norsolorinic acid ketoreductase nor1 n=1 Tax=Pseudocercospora fuligena TaxID=685502 RepID=A0A8H6VNF1_9PEZI|nr:Norsolorinic acid ketoreductase nor1 [Pseudocercospora fuligena]